MDVALAVGVETGSVSADESSVTSRTRSPLLLLLLLLLPFILLDGVGADAFDAFDTFDPFVVFGVDVFGVFDVFGAFDAFDAFAADVSASWGMFISISASLLVLALAPSAAFVGGSLSIIIDID